MDPRQDRLTRKKKSRGPAKEIAVIGEVDDWEADVVRELLEVRPGGECTIYIDSTGGSVYGALAVVTLLRQRKLKATAVVLGECSSATVLLFAACQKRLVTKHSTFLFHRMFWRSEKRIGSEEAVNWARHFEGLERDMDALQLRLFGQSEEVVSEWIRSGRFVSGQEVVQAGLAEMLEL